MKTTQYYFMVGDMYVSNTWLNSGGVDLINIVDKKHLFNVSEATRVLEFLIEHNMNPTIHEVTIHAEDKMVSEIF